MQAVRPLRVESVGRRRNKVRSTLRRKNRTYFIVSANEQFQLPPTRGSRVLLVRNSQVALQVDAIDRMAELDRILALPRAFSGEERVWYRGLALMDGRVIPVVNPQSLLSETEIEGLRLAMRKEEHELVGAAR